MRCLVLVVFANVLGCARYDDCDRAAERLDECGLPHPTCDPTRETDLCVAECVSTSECDELGTSDCDRFCTPIDTGDPDTPLVLSFDAGPVEFKPGGPAFDLGHGRVFTDWPRAVTPWLAFDRDGDGKIADGTELFGSATRLGAGGTASNGFVALRELDANGDGELTRADPLFGRLAAWADLDADRAVGLGELRPLAAYGVEAIGLDYASGRSCDARENCEGERSELRYWSSGRLLFGEVIDVYLGKQAPAADIRLPDAGRAVAGEPAQG